MHQPGSSSPQTSFDLRPGDRFHHYDVVGFLGAGYSGQVYEVAHRFTGERYALKTMRLGGREDPRGVARALAEARGTHRIEHRNVVKVHDLACEPDGRVWMLMELLRGETVWKRVNERGRLSPLYALAIAIDAAWGLDAAHEARTIHRDVKPEHVFLLADGPVKIIDFSLAKVFPEGLETTLGRVGLGTTAYMAPERFRGARPDARFDVYGLGLTLWFMLAGRHPFQEAFGDVAEMIRKQMHAAPPSLTAVAGLPAYVDAVVQRALAKSPDARFVSMAEMAKALIEARERLKSDAAEGRIDLAAKAGERASVPDPNARRDYQPPEEAPEADAPRLPSRTIVVKPAALAKTAPLDPAMIARIALPSAPAPAAMASPAPPTPPTPPPQAAFGSTSFTGRAAVPPPALARTASLGDGIGTLGLPSPARETPPALVQTGDRETHRPAAGSARRAVVSTLLAVVAVAVIAAVIMAVGSHGLH